MGVFDSEFTIKTTADRVYRRFHNQAIDEEMKDWANQQLREIQPDLDTVLEFDDGYRSFLLDYIPREVEKFRADTVEQIPYDELREKPICTCGDVGCQLKGGRLPHAVTEADTIEDGIERFKQEHRGSPEVLLDAAEEWRKMHRDCWFVLRHIEAHMVEGRTEPPEEDPLADADADDVKTNAAD